MLLRRLHRKARESRGAALVEAAFITPVFAVLIFGIIEFGLAFRDYLTVANASRDGARAASAFGDDQYADWNTIQVTLQATKGFKPNEIRRLIIFDAGGVGGSVLKPSHPAHACLTATVGITNVCNVYDAADMRLAPGEWRQFSLDDVLLHARDPHLSGTMHYAGLAEALVLAEALDQLPPEIAVIGVQPATTDWELGLSAPVQAVLGSITETVLTAVAAISPM